MNTYIEDSSERRVITVEGYSSFVSEVSALIEAQYPNKKYGIVHELPRDSVFDKLTFVVETFQLYPEDRCDIHSVRELCPEPERFTAKGVLVEVISVPTGGLDPAVAYFSWPCLGCIMERVAQNIGLWYGGISGNCALYDHPINQLSPSVVTRNVEEIFNYLGYDYGRWTRGFRDREEVFQYAISTKYFHPGIFLPETTSSDASSEDFNMAEMDRFCLWLLTAKGVPHYPYSDHPSLSR